MLVSEHAGAGAVIDDDDNDDDGNDKQVSRTW